MAPALQRAHVRLRCSWQSGRRCSASRAPLRAGSALGATACCSTRSGERVQARACGSAARAAGGGQQGRRRRRDQHLGGRGGQRRHRGHLRGAPGLRGVRVAQPGACTRPHALSLCSPGEPHCDCWSATCAAAVPFSHTHAEPCRTAAHVWPRASQAPVRDTYLIQQLVGLLSEANGLRMNTILFDVFYLMGVYPCIFASLLVPSARSASKVRVEGCGRLGLRKPCTPPRRAVIELHLLPTGRCPRGRSLHSRLALASSGCCRTSACGSHARTRSRRHRRRSWIRRRGLAALACRRRSLCGCQPC